MNFSSLVSKNLVKVNLKSLTIWAHLGSRIWRQNGDFPNGYHQALLERKA
jgi:hypothetical protein